MAHSIVITIKDGDDVVAIDQIPVDPKIGNKLIAKVEIVDVPPRARQKRDRNPLHPRALKLADLRVGMRIRVNHKDNPGWSYSAIVGGASPPRTSTTSLLSRLFDSETSLTMSWDILKTWG